MVTDAAAEAVPERRGNYFVRHWRGELSLPLSFWVNGIVLTLAINVVMFALAQWVNGLEAGLRLISAGVILFFFGLFAFFVWAIVGIWRSAGHHKQRGGSAGWANVARATMCLWMLSFAAQIHGTYLPQLKTYGLIAIGHDPLGAPADITLSEDGKAVIVRGTLTTGIAARFAAVLNGAPGAGTVVLQSNGGRMLEARAMASAIRRRGLNTYVEHQCLSACTLLLIAGRDRAMEPNAQIGFHAFSFPGVDFDSENNPARAVYAAAGISEDFIRHAMTIPAAQMWYPTLHELVSAGVITRQTLGGETTASFSEIASKAALRDAMDALPVFSALKRHQPALFDRVVDAAWSERTRGGSDAQISQAGRNVLMTALPGILRTASPATVAGYFTIGSEELVAAKAVSDEACDRLIHGELDIGRVLPEQFLTRELAVLQQAIEDNPGAAPPLDTATTTALVRQAATVALTPAQLDVLVHPEHADAAALCDANIALRKVITQLGPGERDSAERLFLTTG